MKVMTIVGTRPEIIKLAQTLKELDKYCKHIIVHTGQNFDYELNEIFFKDLELQKHMIWNEAMTFLGLNNSNQDKRERLVANEVEANNEQVEGCLNAGLKARQRACREINRIFGTNISVRKRIQETPKLSDSEPFEEAPNDSEGGEE